MSYVGRPTNVRSLDQRLRNLVQEDGLVLRRRTAMALVVVGQMLPAGAVKGGSAMALRYGTATRFTTDLDAASAQPLATFKRDFEDSLAEGWCGFTGRLVQLPAPRPAGVPSAYVMQPFEIKLAFESKSWCTVKFELGHNEIGDADEPEYFLADELAEMFTAVGLDAPRPVRVMRAHHQIAQKLHAASSPGSERAHDLVDIQLLDSGEVLDLALIHRTCTRLFAYRAQQSWPPRIVGAASWNELYQAAAEDLDVLPTVEQALSWTNDFISTIASTQAD